MPLADPLKRKPVKFAPRKAKPVVSPFHLGDLGSTVAKRVATNARVRYRDVDPTTGVSNPYGISVQAYEPNTEVFEPAKTYRFDPGSDNPILKGYDDAFNAVQADRQREDTAAQTAAENQTKMMSGFSGSSAGLTKDVPYADTFNQAAVQYGISAGLLAAVARAESNFNANARSPAGAQGLMQFMPGTARGLNVNPFDATSSIFGAAKYLRQQIDAFGSVDLALAAYNAGPGNVRKYKGIPPFNETQNYVTRVKNYMGEYPQSTGVSFNAAPGPIVSGSGIASQIIAKASELIGKPYIWGGTTARGVDCSGLLFYAFNQAGIKMPRYRAVDYGKLGSQVTAAEARPGDIVYWDNPNTTTDHVGLYIGNGQVIQSPQSGDVTKVSKVWGNAVYRRVLNDDQFGQFAAANGGTALSYAGAPAAQTFNRFVSIASPVQNLRGGTSGA